MDLPKRQRYHRHPFLPRPSAPEEARRKNDDGGRGRNGNLVSSTPAPRDGPRPQSRLPVGERQTLAKNIRADLARIFRKLSRAAVQPPIRAPLGRLLCPEPPGRRFRRDGRDLVDARSGMATAVSRLEGFAKTRVRR